MVEPGTARQTLRVAHVTASFPPYRGGTGNVCYHNARELVRRGHEVHVFTAALAGAAAYEQRDGIHVHRLRPLVQVGNAPLLPGLLTALHGFDLVHLHYPFFGGEISALPAWLTRTPLVVTYHQDVLLPGVAGTVATALRQTLGRWALRSARRVLFTSADYGSVSHARPLLRGRGGRIGALANGVDTTTFTPGPASALHERLGLAVDAQVALLVAGLDRAHYFKGVEVFLAALAQLPPTTVGVIVGDGDMRVHYQAVAERLRLGQQVIFAGRVGDADLPDYYRLAAVTVLPSVTMGEAFGLVLLESLACATPVIASNIPGVRTVVSAGQDGLLVAPNDAAALAWALTQMLADDAARQAMGRSGRAKVVARYDWRVIGAELEQIYGAVLRERTPRAAR